MRGIAKSLIHIIFTAIKIAVIAYTLSIMVQLFTDFNWLDIYNRFLIQFAHRYMSWSIILLYFLYLISNTNYDEALADIRYRHYANEVSRWEASGYIAPTHLHYLLSPPLSYKKTVIDQLEDPLYVQAIHDFRDRVYSNEQGSSNIPKSMKHRSILGEEYKSQIIIYSLIIVLCCTLPYIMNYSILHQPANLTFLVLIHSFNKILIIYLSCKHFKFYELNNFLSKSYPNPIQWEYCFSSTSLGQNIILSWENECDRRNRLYRQYYGKDSDYSKYPSIPPAPFPDLRIMSEPQVSDLPVLTSLTSIEKRSHLDSKVVSLNQFRKQKTEQDHLETQY